MNASKTIDIDGYTVKYGRKYVTILNKSQDPSALKVVRLSVNSDITSPEDLAKDGLLYYVFLLAHSSFYCKKCSPNGIVKDALEFMS